MAPLTDWQPMTPPAEIVAKACAEAMRSPCRSQRGAVVFRHYDGAPGCMARGHNDKPEGFACDGSEACKATCRQEAVHAEQHALLRAGLHAQGSDLLHVKVVDQVLVPSGGPSCVQCSKLSLVAGIRFVWLFHESGWRRYDATEFHRLSLAAASQDGREPT